MPHSGASQAKFKKVTQLCGVSGDTHSSHCVKGPEAATEKAQVERAELEREGGDFKGEILARGIIIWMVIKIMELDEITQGDVGPTGMPCFTHSSFPHQILTPSPCQKYRCG